MLKVNSSVTWNWLASTFTGSSNWTLRSRRSVSTNTVLRPLRNSQASRLPSMVGRTRTSRRTMSCARAALTMPGFSFANCPNNTASSTGLVTPPWRKFRASSGGRYFHPASTA